MLRGHCYLCRRIHYSLPSIACLKRTNRARHQYRAATARARYHLLSSRPRRLTCERSRFSLSVTTSSYPPVRGCTRGLGPLGKTQFQRVPSRTNLGCSRCYSYWCLSVPTVQFLSLLHLLHPNQPPAKLPSSTCFRSCVNQEHHPQSTPSVRMVPHPSYQQGYRVIAEGGSLRS